jgi:tetratricopeptide (TPR) repeat protein
LILRAELAVSQSSLGVAFATSVIDAAVQTPVSYEEGLSQATTLHGLGRLDEAEAWYRDLLPRPEAQTEILHFVLGVLFSEKGDAAGAIAHYDQAEAFGFGAVELFRRRAALLRADGRLEKALTDYERALAVGGEQAELRRDQGVTLAALDRPLEALASYDRALTLDPADHRAFNNRGVTLEKLGRLDEALASYDRAVALQGDYRHAHHNRGSVLLRLKRSREASESLRCSLAIWGGEAESWNLLGMALGELESYHEALTCFERALALKPSHAEASNNLSIAQRWVGRFTDAVASADRALALDPGLAAALNSRGAALARLNRHREALEDFEAALKLQPDFAAVILNRGCAREALGDLDGAARDFNTVHRLEPTAPDSLVCLSLTHLRRGDLARGFDLYQRRWDRPAGPFLAHSRATLWTGRQAVDGRTVLLWAEQGFGDVVQFCRFAADVAALGARVTLQAPPSLKRVMRSLAGPIEVIDSTETPPPFDLHAPLMNLPAALGVSLADLPGRGAYLSAPASVKAIWAKQAQADLTPRLDRPRIGLAWRGNPGHENNHNRSAPFAALSPLFDASVDFVSLQKVHSAEDRAGMAGVVEAFDHRLGDFADTAALIDQCDAVVSVDTAVAHLAAAMGKPVFLLLPKFAEWRWMNERSDTPWYATVRLLRQEAFGDWRGPVAAAAELISRIQRDRA